MPNDPTDPFEKPQGRDEPKAHEPPPRNPPDEAPTVQFGEDPGNVEAEDLGRS
jgi:hypothetical protein